MPRLPEMQHPGTREHTSKHGLRFNAVKAVVAHLKSPVGKVPSANPKYAPLLFRQRINRMRADNQRRALSLLLELDQGMSAWGADSTNVEWLRAVANEA